MFTFPIRVIGILEASTGGSVCGIGVAELETSGSAARIADEVATTPAPAEAAVLKNARRSERPGWPREPLRIPRVPSVPYSDRNGIMPHYHYSEAL